MRVRSLLLRMLADKSVATRTECLHLVREHVLDDALADGAVCRVFPRVYCLPAERDLLAVRRRAALAYRPTAALSHGDALDLWSVPGLSDLTASRVIHVTETAGRPAVRFPGLVVHRLRGFDPATSVMCRDGFPVVRLEEAIIGAWSIADSLSRRVPAIVAVRERRTTAGRLRSVLNVTPRVVARAELEHTLELLGAGCHSPLEIWGHERVFADHRLPPSMAQHRVLIRGATIWLDRWYDVEMVAVELDGAAYHGAAGQRERDLRRDAALAALGIQTVRFSHPRLVQAPEQVIGELRQILATRRHQLRSATPA